MVLAFAEITLARVDDGKSISSITEEYYLSTSKTTQTGGSWTTTPPTWSSGKYVWTRSKIVYTNPSSTAYTTPICDSSWEAVNEVQGGVNTSISGIDVEYYLSTSPLELSGGSWDTTAPEWTNGTYMWSRTKTTLNNGTVSYKPSEGGTCIAGSKDVDNELENIRQTIVQKESEILEQAGVITMTALENYTEKTEYESFVQATESKFEQTANSFSLNIDRVTNSIESVEGQVTTVNEVLSKHFEFTENGLNIRAGVGEMEITIDNDIIYFSKDGQRFGSWDGNYFHTGNIVIEANERAQFGNFAFVPRSNGNVSWLKVGG